MLQDRVGDLLSPGVGMENPELTAKVALPVLRLHAIAGTFGHNHFAFGIWSDQVIAIQIRNPRRFDVGLAHAGDPAAFEALSLSGRRMTVEPDELQRLTVGLNKARGGSAVPRILAWRWIRPRLSATPCCSSRGTSPDTG